MSDDYSERINNIYTPALERIHQLARRLKAPAHQQRLLAHHAEGILEQASLVFYRRRRRHCFWRASDSGNNGWTESCELAEGV